LVAVSILHLGDLLLTTLGREACLRGKAFGGADINLRIQFLIVPLFDEVEAGCLGKALRFVLRVMSVKSSFYRRWNK
jgi:hypothetical protein